MNTESKLKHQGLLSNALDCLLNSFRFAMKPLTLYIYIYCALRYRSFSIR